MIDTGNNIGTKTIKLDAKLVEAIAKFDPGMIHSIGINPNEREVVIGFVNPETIDKAGNAEQTIRFSFDKSFAFLRGLVRSNGIVLTGMDNGFYEDHPEITATVIDAIDEAFGAKINDLYLVTPERQFAFFAIKDAIWRPIDVESVTSIAGNAILGCIDGRLMTLTPNAIANLFETGEANWGEVQGFDENIAYLGGGSSRQILATTLTGKIRAVQLKSAGNRFRVSSITPISTRALQAFGPIFGQPNIAAAVTEQAGNEVAITLFPTAQFQAAI